MKLDSISVGRVQEAVRIYFEVAYEGAEPPDSPIHRLPATASMSDVLAVFADERHDSHEKRAHRYVLRLGSRNYPFMKCVLQECLFEGEYFFVVDTHDQMEVRPNTPDYDAWIDLQRINRQVKAEIEKRWQSADVPTTSDLRRFVSALQTPQRRDALPQGPGKTILVVDDERAMAETVAALLEARGYRTITAFDGREALDRLRLTHPDLILLDYEMPEIDGVQLAEKIKAGESTKDIPVLLATASSIDLSEIAQADGFLVKPFQREILFFHIAHLLRR